MNIPNLICYFRIVLTFYAFYQFYSDQNKLLFLALTIVAVALDGLDGVIARRLNQCTEFGAKLDIFADRITELAYWFFFAYIDLIGYWVFVFYLIRGVTVDYLTRKQAKPLGNSWLRSSHIMRGTYGSLKLLSFVLLILMPQYQVLGFNLSHIVVYLTVFVCFLRALPVILNND